MGLQSKHFKGDPKLEACLIRHDAHVVKGATGDHVRKIHVALMALDNLTIASAELDAKHYGTSTEEAVLKFKKKRKIINFAYQNTEDKIVGKMTLDALDREMKGLEDGSVSPDMQIVNQADMRRLMALAKAEKEILRMKLAFEPDVPDESDPTVKAFQRQLFLNLDSNFWFNVNQVLSMIRSNRLIQAPFHIDKSKPEFAHVDPSLDPGKGVTFCASFFAGTTTDNCRDEVTAHEFFHFIVGAQHFYSATASGEALKCPHHLARVVFDISRGQQVAPCSLTAGVCR
jgi:hypothetical protein